MTHDNWLNHVVEKALEPDLPICDAHIHLKNHESRRYLAVDFVKDASFGHNIKQSVVVQHAVNYQQGPGGGMSPVDETSFVMKQIAGLKSKIDVATGFIGYVDMAIGGAVQSLLQAQMEAGGKRFKGIRYPLPPAPTLTGPSILSDPKFRDAFAILSKNKLTYELSIGMSQFTELVDLAKVFPDTAIIINHLGWQAGQAKNNEEKNEIIAEWRRRIQLVSKFHNIYMKLGGSTMPRYGFFFDRKDNPPSSQDIVTVTGPYFQFLIEEFGPKRCMFESNFPKERKTSSYNVIWNAFKIMTESFSKTERAYMFQDTANKVYNL